MKSGRDTVMSESSKRVCERSNGAIVVPYGEANEAEASDLKDI